jgi:GMP synthase (glutamine-hydrolysing)
MKALKFIELYQKLGYDNIESRDYSEFFLDAVSAQVDPQLNGIKSVQLLFRCVTNSERMNLSELNGCWTGNTLSYIIESGGTEHAEVIKSHHNRVQEVLDLMSSGKVVEPLKDLYRMKYGRLELYWVARIQLSGGIRSRSRTFNQCFMLQRR